MTSKQYLWSKMAIAAILAIVVGQAYILRSYILIGASVLIAFFLILFLKKRVKEVLADERDYKIGGDVARWALSIFAVLAWLFSFAMIMLRNVNPEYEIVGFTLSYAVCALLIIHMIVGLVFRRIHDGSSNKIRMGYFVLALVSALLVAIAALRFFSGEDDWICKNGQWVKHGNPSASMPITLCK
jgi:uncharacterized membrane protein